MNGRTKTAGIVALALMLAGCISPQNMGAVEAAARTFYQREQQGQAELIYNDASQVFRDATTQQETTQLLAAANAAAKGCAAPVRDPMQFNTNISNTGYTVSVVYHRTCPSGQLDESFLFRFESNVPKLAGYHVSGAPLLAAITNAATATATTAAPDAAAAGKPQESPTASGPDAGKPQDRATSTATTAPTTKS